MSSIFICKEKDMLTAHFWVPNKPLYQNPTKVMVLSRENCYAPCCMPKKPDLNILNGDYNFDLLYYSYPLGSSIKVVNIRHLYTQFSSASSSGLWIIMCSIFHRIFFWHLCKINVYESLNYIIELNWTEFQFVSSWPCLLQILFNWLPPSFF